LLFRGRMDEEEAGCGKNVQLIYVDNIWRNIGDILIGLSCFSPFHLPHTL